MQPQSAQSLRELRRRQNDFSAELADKGWYHSFELPEGISIQGCMSLAWLELIEPIVVSPLCDGGN